jgi:hypothetical protein
VLTPHTFPLDWPLLGTVLTPHTFPLQLIDPIQERTEGTGVWAVITVLIVMQTQTVGGTTHKTVNRVVGTIIAAVAAFGVGAAANLVSSPDRPHAAAVLVGMSILLVTAGVTYLSSSKEWAEWS